MFPLIQSSDQIIFSLLLVLLLIRSIFFFSVFNKKPLTELIDETFNVTINGDFTTNFNSLYVAEFCNMLHHHKRKK